jgi:putative addiction module CopG family antidote
MPQPIDKDNMTSKANGGFIQDGSLPLPQARLKAVWNSERIHGWIGLAEMSKIAKDGYNMVCSLSMKTQALNVNLTAQLRRYIKEQVRAGRYQNENEVVRDAIRQMQQRELEQFERLFGDYPGAPQGEPTTKDHEAIQAAIKRHRDSKSTAQAA